MPKALRLKDGRVLRAPGDIPVEAFDPIATAVQEGAPAPQGFTIEGGETQPGMSPLAPGVRPGMPPGGMDPTQLQQQPIQAAMQRLEGPASRARDVATQGVSHALQFQFPEGVEEQSPKIQEYRQKVAPITQELAKGIVPQTPAQLVSTLALGALSGGTVAPGVTGALLRTFIPPAAGLATDVVLGEAGDEQSARDLLVQIIGGAASEGLPGLVNIASRGKFRQAAIDRIGDAWAEELGRSIGEVTSVKGIKMPLHFERLLSGKHASETAFHNQASETIGRAREEIKRALVPAVAGLDPPQRITMMKLLEDVAEVKPTLHIPKGAPPSLAAPVNRVFPDPPDVLLQKAFERAALSYQKASALEGAEKWEAMQDYGKIVAEIRGALALANPALEAQHVASNIQFARDLDVLDILWDMNQEKRGVIYSKSGRTHLDPAKLSDLMKKEWYPTLERTGMLGGTQGAERLMAGPAAQAGARPTSHEGIMRAFLSTPGLGAATSMVVNPRFMTMPTQVPVQSGMVRGMADLMAIGGLRSMGE